MVDSSRVVAEATSGDIAALNRPFLVIPLGSTEQHGPHLPLGTDSIVAQALAQGLVDEHPHCMLGPSVDIGASGEHEGFAGTLSIGTPMLAAFLQEIVRSARPSFFGVIFVSGHGGNRDALSLVDATAREEGDQVLCFFPRIEGGDAHAGRSETSLILALRPDLVRSDRAEAGSVKAIGELIGEIRDSGVASVSENGVLGDPTGAFADEGSVFVEAMVRQLCELVEERF